MKYFYQGVEYLKQGNNDKAIENFLLSIDNKENNLELSYNAIGMIYLNLNIKSLAKKYFEKALEIDPNNKTFKQNLYLTDDSLYNEDYILLQEKENNHEIEDAFILATNIYIKTHSEEMLFKIGYYNIRLGRFKEAEKIFNCLYNEYSNDKKYIVNLITSLFYQKKYDKGKELLLELEKQFDLYNLVESNEVALYNTFCFLKSIYNFVEGKYEESFPINGYETYFFSKEIIKNTSVLTEFPLYKREGILVLGQWGIGDNINFLRFIPLLKKYYKKIYFYGRDELHSLINVVDKDIICIKKEDYSYSGCYQDYIPLIHIPFLLKLKEKDYKLKTSLFKIESTNSKKELFKFKIGICWFGGKDHELDRIRSIPKNKLYKLKKIFNKYDNIEFVSLGKGYREKECKILGIKNVLENVENYLDTANIINELDLVISVDTSIIHLAGSLFKESLLLLSEANDFRWKNDSDSNLWYPTVKILKQKEFNNWESVFEKIDKYLNDNYKN